MPITATIKSGFNTTGDNSGPVTITPTATGAEIVYTIWNKQHNSVILYMDYTKGTETNLVLNYGRSVDPDTTFYFEVEDTGSGVIKLYTQTIADGDIGSNPIVIPIPKGKDDDKLKIIIEGDNGAAADGSIELFITEDHFAF